ncbi:receptor L domain protein, partial [Ostertagia ostertagi]
IIFENTAIPLERLAVLSSVKKLSGCLRVETTNFETLSFLGNLEEINCGDKKQDPISIYNNNYLTELGLPKLTKIKAHWPMSSQNNRILEITFEEIEALLSTGEPATQINGAFPTENLPPDMCIFNSVTDDLTTLDSNCTSLIGLLYYSHRSFSEKKWKH